MARACEDAQKTIDFEQYIFRNDALGEYFAQLFCRKAQEGVRVRLVLDMFGSLDTYFSPLAKRMRAAGVKLHFYNKLNLLRMVMPWSWFPRMHAKAMLVDERLLFCGGVCFSETMRHWRDTQIGVQGPVAQAAAAQFDRHWHDWRKRLKGRKMPQYSMKAMQGAPFHFLFSRPLHLRNPIYRALRRQVHRARESVWIATPYFTPTPAFVRLLRKAARRGVQVRILLTEISDVGIADLVTRSYLPKLLRAGIHISFYRPAMFHGKIMVVDRNWATVGSMNLDYLSAFRNREANLLIREPAAVAALAQQFAEDFSRCRDAVPQDWHALPLPLKILGRLGRGLRFML
jgi:cardiolipin synthase